MSKKPSASGRWLGLGATLIASAGFTGCGSQATHPSAAGNGTSRPMVGSALLRNLPGGWSQTDDGPNVLTSRGAMSTSTITSWHYQPNSAGPAGDLPRDGILITTRLFRNSGASLCSSTPHLPGYPATSTSHISLRNAARGTLEGDPSTPEFRLLGRHGNDYNFEIRVAIRNRHPNAQLLADAQRALNGLHFPRWPHAC